MALYPVAKDGEISSGYPKIVIIEGKEIGVFYEQKQYYAILNYCPHKKAEICKGRVSGTLYCNKFDNYEMKYDELVLRCPWHHWEFSMKTGKAVIHDVKQRLKTFQVIVEKGIVYINI